MKRTNLILLVLAIGLFAYVTLVDRFGVSSGELEERKDRVVPALVRDRLVAITVERGGERYSLARGERDADGNLRFTVSAPMQVDADSERVDEALGTIEWADAVRTLDGASASDRPRYGLDRPRLRLRFEVGDRTLTVAFGKDDPTGAGVFVEADGKFFVVTSETRDAFDHPVEFFRVRRLAEVPGEVTRLRILNGTNELRAEKGSGGFRLRAPYDVVASEGRVNVVLATLRTLEAVRFVEELPGDLGRFGLSAPRLTVEAGTDADPDAVRMIVGGACETESPSSYVRVGSGPVVCVDGADLEPLFVGADAYRELRASATEPGGVTGIDLSDGRATLSVTDDDGTYRFTMGDASGDADGESFEEWIEGLRNTRATTTRPVDTSFAPGTTLTVHRSGTRTDDVIRFEIRATEVVGRRGDDGLLLVFPRTLAERIEVSTAHVRSRALLHEDPSSLGATTIVRPDGTEALGLVDGEMSVTAPVAVAAETARVAELGARLAGLEAVRFVADRPLPQHGLDRPRYQVRFRFGTGSEHTLAIGASVDGDDAYARLDGTSPVFVVVGATVELLATPFASRQELSTESLYIDGITVRRGATTTTLRRDGSHLVGAAGPIDDAATNRVMSAVADLRASSIAAYGAPRADTGLARPVAEIRVRRATEAGAPSEMVFSIGATVGGADDRRTYLRRSDRNLVYLVPEAALAPILDLAR